MKCENSILLLFFFCSIIVLTGCNGNIPLSGKVTFSDDGSPLTKGIVYFETPTFRAQGEIKPNGTYKVITTVNSKGIPPGEYKVYIGGAMDVKKENVHSVPTVVNIPLIDNKHANPTTSGWTLKVDRSTRNYDIVVDRPR